MKLAALSSFLRCLKRHPEAKPEAVFAVMKAAAEAYGNPHRHARIGLRLIGDFMECRDSLDMRLIFQRSGDTLEFHFYGTHDEVRQFLKKK
jgi:mRNA-degrading endonuclease YafQ of YafQ-DinJ toxin-antitoxin module